MFKKIKIKNFESEIIRNLSIYLFLYYFFIRVVYTVYVDVLNLSVWVYRIGFYIPLFLWFLFIFKYLYNNQKYLKINTYMKTLLFLIFYMGAVTLYYHYFGNQYITDIVIAYQAKIIFYAVFSLLLGFYLYENLLTIKIRYTLFLIYLFYLCLLFINRDILGIAFQPIRGLHLLFGDTFVIISIFGIFLYLKNRHLKTVFLTVSLIFLYYIESRASLYSFFVVYIFFLLKEYNIKKFIYISILALFIFFITIKLNIIHIDSRMFVVGHLVNDNSFNDRLGQFKAGIESIKHHWLFGEFAGQIVVHKYGYFRFCMGCFMHNWLSYWRQYGFIFFIFLTSLYLYTSINIFTKWISYKNNEVVNVLFYLTLFVGVEILLFRSYANTMIWFVFGLIYRYIYYEKKADNDKSNLNSIK